MYISVFPAFCRPDILILIVDELQLLGIDINIDSSGNPTQNPSYLLLTNTKLFCDKTETKHKDIVLNVLLKYNFKIISY